MTTPVDGLRKLFGFDQLPNLPARYNIAPTQAVLAVRSDDSGGREAFMARWGLIPGWAKDPSIGAKTINARAETIAEKPAYKAAFRRRRCLVPVDAFYEWVNADRSDGKKQPHCIYFEDRDPFAFAGVWERWQGGDGSDVETLSIVTTEASAAIAPLHHRMPVILDPSNFRTWLTGDPEAAGALMTPYEGARVIAFHPVSTRVNNVRNDDSGLWEFEEPVVDAPEPPKKAQLSLF